MRYLILFFLFACTSAPPARNFMSANIKHKECLAPVENLSVSLPARIQNAFLQTTGTAGSLLVTSAGVVSDTVVVSTGVAGVALCGYGNASSAGCGDLIGGYFGLMDHMGLIWTTKKAYQGTSSWRCPEVDHISRAYRKVTRCLHKNGELVEAFEQMGRLEHDELLSECASDVEKEKWAELNLELRRVP